MNMRKAMGGFWAALPMAMVLAGPAAAQDGPVRIGVIEDLSGVYSGNGGPNAVLAVQMAVEDFGGSVLGRPVEVLQADHQSKPDVGAQSAGSMIDEQGASALVLGGASSVGLAVQALAAERGVVTLVTGGYAGTFSGAQCSPYGFQWAPSTDALSVAAARGIAAGEARSWFFITADYAYGHALVADATAAIEAAGGSIAGETRHPLNTQDFSSPLLLAQASGADVIGLANAGPDLVNTIKQSREFGVGNLASMLVFENNVVALGLDVAQGMRFPVNFYWDRNEASRDFGTRIMERNGGDVPTMGHAMAYLSTTQYLKAVEAAGTLEAEAVSAALRAMPIENGLVDNATIQANGRVVMDMHLVEVKTPDESTGPADLYEITATLPGGELFRTAEASGCPLTQ